jgi:cytochrome c oxidase assembly factor CtaG
VSRRRLRSGALVAGVGCCLTAVSPPVDAAADGSLTAHMVQHVLLTMVGPPLILIGSPLALALRRAPRPLGRRLVALGHRRPLRVLTAPLLGWALLPAVQLAVHTGPLFQLVLQDARVHALEHLLLLGSALLFWRPVVGADPVRRLHPLARVVYVLAAMPANDVVGVWLMSSTGIEYPAYAHAGLADQHRGGAVMLAGSFALAAAGLAAAWSWVQADHRRALLGEGAR